MPNMHRCYRCRPRTSTVADNLRATRALDRASEAAQQGDREGAAAAMREAERYAKHISATHCDVDAIELFVARIYGRMHDVCAMLREAADRYTDGQ